jgi:small subunit ribosomal protein S20
MANIRSQIKRNRQNESRRARNRGVRTRLRTFNRRFDDAVAAGDRDTAEEAYRIAARELDKAVNKGVVHRNTAANRKSSMATRLNRL